MRVQACIGLGANLGCRHRQLQRAIAYLSLHPEISVIRISPCYETPALLAEGAPEAWNIPYLNQAILVSTTLAPEVLLQVLKACEAHLGRKARGHWAPREMDCDLLLHGQEVIATDLLTVPHPRLPERGFVLAPLNDIVADWQVPTMQQTVAALWRACPDKAVTRVPAILPALMGIVNVTPDSFSDGGAYATAHRALAQVKTLADAGATWVDIGAESTRPGAVPVSPEEEWERLEPVLAGLADMPDRPLLSIDSYRVATLRRALSYGVEMLNDVSALASPEMLSLALKSGASLAVMHSLSVPVDPAVHVPEDADVAGVIIGWAEEICERAEREGLPFARLILDPGIGFGKTAAQSLALITQAARIRAALPDEVRLLYGHSRKSFLRLFADVPAQERDALTLAFSAQLADAGVDMLRVHDVSAHQALWEKLA